MGEVGRVLRAVQQELGDRGVVWASDEDTIEGRSDLGFEPAAGYAAVGLLALDDHQRYGFASHLDGVGVPELMRRESTPHSRRGGGAPPARRVPRSAGRAYRRH